MLSEVWLEGASSPPLSDHSASRRGRRRTTPTTPNNSQATEPSWENGRSPPSPATASVSWVPNLFAKGSAHCATPAVSKSEARGEPDSVRGSARDPGILSTGKATRRARAPKTGMGRTRGPGYVGGTATRGVLSREPLPSAGSFPAPRKSSGSAPPRVGHRPD